MSDECYAGKLLLFGGIASCRSRRQLLSGDTLELSIEIGCLSARAGRGTGQATVNGDAACEAELLFVIPAPERRRYHLAQSS